MIIAPHERLSALLSRNLGVLADLLADPSVLHISVTAAGSIFVERFGTGPAQQRATLTVAERGSIIRLISTHAGRSTTEQHCRLSAIMPDGERFQGFLPPAVAAPAFEIRKRPARIYTLADYVTAGIATEAQAEWIRSAVNAKDNIIVAGGTLSGKTTLLNALLDTLADSHEHLVTLEDTPELQVRAPYWLGLYTVPGQTTMTDLVADALRCNPTRIIVGEVRGGEALDVLDAWNTGHPGGLLSLHANPGMVMQRLESLVRRANIAHPLQASDARAVMAEAVKAIVEIQRIPTAPGRRITAIRQCHGLNSNGQSYIMEDMTW